MNEDGTGGGVDVIKGVLIESKLYLLILRFHSETIARTVWNLVSLANFASNACGQEFG